MNKEELFKQLQKEFKEDIVINQQLETLSFNGFEFGNIDANLEEKKSADYKIEFDVELEYQYPSFIKAFLKRKDITEIDFSYSDFKIEINDIELDNETDFYTKKTKTYSKLANDDEMNYVEEIEEKDDESKESIKRKKTKLINEIESNINEQLKLLKSDTDKLISRINSFVEDYNTLKGNGKSIRSLFKQFKNYRNKDSVIKDYQNMYQNKLDSIKVKLLKKDNEIREKKAEKTVYNFWSWSKIGQEVKVLVTERDILKSKFDMLKTNYKRVLDEIETMVEEKFELLLFDKLQENQDMKDVKIDKFEIYRYTLKFYKKIVSQYDIN